MKLVQSTETRNTMLTGGSKSSPESTMTQSQSYAPQPSQFRKSSKFGWMASWLSGSTEADQGAADLKVSGSLTFDVKKNTPNTKSWASMSGSMVSLSGNQDSTHKLIDLGTAVAVHDVDDDQANDTLKTVTEMEFAG